MVIRNGIEERICSRGGAAVCLSPPLSSSQELLTGGKRLEVTPWSLAAAAFDESHDTRNFSIVAEGVAVQRWGAFEKLAQRKMKLATLSPWFNLMWFRFGEPDRPSNP